MHIYLKAYKGHVSYVGPFSFFTLPLHSKLIGPEVSGCCRFTATKAHAKLVYCLVGGRDGGPRAVPFLLFLRLKGEGGELSDGVTTSVARFQNNTARGASSARGVVLEACHASLFFSFAAGTKVPAQSADESAPRCGIVGRYRAPRPDGTAIKQVGETKCQKGPLAVQIVLVR